MCTTFCTGENDKSVEQSYDSKTYLPMTQTALRYGTKKDFLREKKLHLAEVIGRNLCGLRNTTTVKTKSFNQ